MKRERIIIYILIILLVAAALLVYFQRDNIFQRGNPLPYIQKMLLLNDQTTFIDVFDDGKVFITKKYIEKELFKYIEEEYDVMYKEQLGSGYLFESDTKKITLNSQIYWHDYMVWDVNMK